MKPYTDTERVEFLASHITQYGVWKKKTDWDYTFNASVINTEEKKEAFKQALDARIRRFPIRLGE